MNTGGWSLAAEARKSLLVFTFNEEEEEDDDEATTK